MAMQRKAAVKGEVDRLVEIAMTPGYLDPEHRSACMLGALSALRWVLQVGAESPSEYLTRVSAESAR